MMQISWSTYRDTLSEVVIAREAAREILAAHMRGEYTIDQAGDILDACLAMAGTDEEAQPFRDAKEGLR